MGDAGSDGSGDPPPPPPPPSTAVAWLARGLESLVDDLPFVAEGQAKPSDPDFDADLVIVGSGYGAAVAAREFAGCTVEGRPLKICILERGDEYLSGAFPSRMAELPGHVRFSTPANPKPRGRRNGLFDVRVGGDVIALVANGVGGGSLINAGVMLEPDPAVFRQPAWPWPLREGEDLSDHFDTVRDWLGAGPRGQPNTVAEAPSGGWPKTRALQTLRGMRTQLVPITVAVEDGTRTVAGVPLNACIGCGDCATGCNHGAKNSLDVGLLAQACRSANVTLVTGATVLRVEQSPPGRTAERSRWSVIVQHTDDKLRLRQGRPFVMRARFVVLAAGTLGSTEILLRSRQHGLGLSPRLGERFSANGDLIASLQDLGADVDAVADEARAPEQRQVGPTITAMVAERTRAGRFVVQDLAVPGPMRQLFTELFTTARVLHDLPECDRRAHTPQDADPCAVNTAVIDRHTLPVAMIGHDNSDGRLTLVSAHGVAPAHPTAADDEGDGALRIDWPGLKDDERWQRQHAVLGDMLGRSGLGGRLLPNPAWQLLPDDLQEGLDVPRGPLITVHPLGGCAMGDDGHSGVVDHLGRVFRADAAATGDPDPVHFGLVVLDGSIVPTSLGINPALTIAALARRAATALRAHWKLSAPAPAAPDSGPRPVFREPAHEERPEPTRVELVERMQGPAWLDVGKPATIELTLFSLPTPLRALMTPAPERRIRMDPQRSRLRIYRGELSPLDDEVPEGNMLLEASLAGTLTIFRREATEKCPRTRRALAAWWRNRGRRDLVQRLADKGPGGVGLVDTVRQTLALASRAGAVRTLDYALTVQGAGGALAPQFPDGSRVAGVKRLRYDLAASPLQQLMDMVLTECPGLARGEAPTLSLHLPFLAKEAVPLMRVVGQANQPQALADLASFAAYLARILIDGHLWSFRKPDRASEREPQRLPGRVPGAPLPQVSKIDVAPAKDADAESGAAAVPAASIQLTRYCPDAVDRSLPPVLMIHGYSASGTTFAHPTLNPGLMAHLTTQHRRDVWVLDLRSSCGMPTATHPWAFEDMGCEDIPVAVEAVCAASGFEQIDIVAHCMGSAMLFMGLLGRNEFDAAGPMLPLLGAQEQLRHQLWDRDLIHWQGPNQSNAPRPGDDRPGRSRIRRLVMSQVGPAVLVTPGNIARAYLMRYLQHFIGGGRYEFRTTGEPGLADQLTDRLLAALPYPRGEFERENPFWPPGQRLRWVGSRHRIDALFGRVFNLANMEEATLEHIDDFFGPFCVDTVSQVIHLARYWTITDRSGFNRFVEPQRLRQRLTFPMMSLHAKANGLADVATGELLRRQIEPNLGRGGSLKRETLPCGNLGHQDSLIGSRQATLPVLEAIARFLQERQPTEAANA